MGTINWTGIPFILGEVVLIALRSYNFWFVVAVVVISSWAFQEVVNSEAMLKSVYSCEDSIDRFLWWEGVSEAPEWCPND